MPKRLLALISIAIFAAASLAVAPARASDPACEWTRTRIVGGSPARLVNWPGQAALRHHAEAARTSAYFCGATAISPRWVLTAAHCLHDYLKPQPPEIPGDDGIGYTARLQVVLGTAGLGDAVPENVFEVERFVLHPAYRRAVDAELAAGDIDLALRLEQIAPREGNDIALLRLDRDWEGPLARPSLAAAPADETGVQVRVAGFGRTDNRTFDIYARSHRLRDGSGRFFAFSEHLLETVVETRSAAACRRQYPGGLIGPGQICAGLDEGGRDSCGGDSGGPLIRRDADGCPRQIGLVSWGGNMCATSDAFGVYTRLAAHAGWLRETTGLALRDDGAAAMPAHDRLTAAQSDEAVAQLRELFGPAGARVSVAIEDRRNRPVGPRLRLGDAVIFRASSTVTGRLVVIDVNAVGEVALLYPNKYVDENAIGLIEAGRTVRIPGPGYPGFTHFQAVEPLGRGRLLVLLVPRDFAIERHVAPKRELTRGFAARNEPASYLMRVVRQIAVALRLRARAAGGLRTEQERWGFAAYDYEIAR